ncbi:hypothetical protein [Marivivens marinus]|uniref:hypothetical protein n=1 Tax=Marivivens marinus TaxID=3110173 RepID=UPI003B84810B
MKKFLMMGAAALALAACDTAVPDSGRGVGFDDYTAYELERAAAEGRGALPAAPTVSEGAIPSSDLASAGIGAQIDEVAAATGRTQGIDASPTNAAPTVINNSGISDEQDFDAVAGRESIESDAERLSRMADQYQIVDPGAVPTRHGDAGPNIVEYALNAPNAKGQEWYSRFIMSGQGRFQRNCAKYASPDEAQRDFLSRGGPERDPRGIDPDGDGFACGWDPEPFRAAVRAAQQEAGN